MSLCSVTLSSFSSTSGVSGWRLNLNEDFVLREKSSFGLNKSEVSPLMGKLGKLRCGVTAGTWGGAAVTKSSLEAVVGEAAVAGGVVRSTSSAPMTILLETVVLGLKNNSPGGRIF